AQQLDPQGRVQSRTPHRDQAETLDLDAQAWTADSPHDQRRTSKQVAVIRFLAEVRDLRSIGHGAPDVPGQVARPAKLEQQLRALRDICRSSIVQRKLEYANRL